MQIARKGIFQKGKPQTEKVLAWDILGAARTVAERSK